MKTNKQGFVLLLGLVFVGVIALGSTLLFQMSSQKAFTETNRADQIRARMIAEAGVHHTYAMLKEDFSLADQPFPDGTVNGGTYSIDITDVDSPADATSDEILLASTGTYNGKQAEAAIIIKHSGGSTPSGPDPMILKLFDGAIFCGGTAKMVGASYIELNGGTAHINGQVTMTGSAQFRNSGFVSSSTGISLSGNPHIEANVAVPTAPNIPWGSQSDFIDGSVTIGSVPEQMIEIDLEPFRVYALAGDVPGKNYKNTAWNEVYTDPYISADEMPSNGKLTIGACQTVDPAGGVLWVEGSVKFAGSSTIKACVIATGDIDVLGGMTHANPGGLPAFMSVNGTTHVGSGCTAYGLIYSHNGDILVDGNASVKGAFICPRGNFDHRGSGKILYENSRPYGPNGEIVMLPQPEAGEAGGSPKVSVWVK